MTTKQQSSKLQLTPFSEQLDQRIHWRLGMKLVLKSDHISERYLALLTTMLFIQHRVSFTLRPVCVKIEITTTLHFSVKDKTSQHTPFSFTVRLISSSRMRVIFIFCGSSPGYLQNLKEIILCDST